MVFSVSVDDEPCELSDRLVFVWLVMAAPLVFFDAVKLLVLWGHSVNLCSMARTWKFNEKNNVVSWILEKFSRK